MKIQAPQHWCRQSIEKLSPWVWLMQSVISLWYITEGRKPAVSQAARRRFDKWDTEWSLAHMLHILRATILANTINGKSATKADLCQLLEDLENYPESRRLTGLKSAKVQISCSGPIQKHCSTRQSGSRWPWLDRRDLDVENSFATPDSRER